MIYSIWTMLCSLGSIAVFIFGLVRLDINPYIWVAGLVFYFLHPFINEPLLNLKALICRRSLLLHNCNKFNDVYPIVYSPSYNISFFGLEKIHPFDSQKYRRVFTALEKKKIIDKSTKIHAPGIPSREFLLEKMSWFYLFRLNFSIAICACLEVPLFFLPAFALRFRVLNPMARATQGSVDASCMAFKYGWAINLSGGYHHACCTKGGGFCIYPDITFVVHYARKCHGIKRVLIIDLDAHQGNGHERDALNDANVHIVDCYNPNIYPGDDFAEKAIGTRIAVTSYDDDSSYINKLMNELPAVYESFRPELVIYNAGTDCMEHDPLGRLNLSPAGIIGRDELMFSFALEDYKVPIVMLLSGGYQLSNAPVIADSIENLTNRFNLKKRAME